MASHADKNPAEDFTEIHSQSHPFFTPSETKSNRSEILDDNPPLSTTRRANIVPFYERCIRYLTDSWIVEYSSLCVALTTLAAIFIVLAEYNSRSLSDWKHDFNLNTVLAILSTVVKGTTILPVAAALGQLKWAWYFQEKRPLKDFQVFDAASRGPVGAIWLLTRLRFRGWHYASLGAVVTIIALASDAFVQASVTYPLRRDQIGSASVPISHNYSLHANSDQSGFAELFDVEPSMKAAIYDGVFSKNISQLLTTISAQCATGNCTIPSYATMGVCPRCIDRTSMLSIVHNVTSDVYTASLPVLDPYTGGSRLLDLQAGINQFNLLNITAEQGDPPAWDQHQNITLANVTMIMFDGDPVTPTFYGKGSPSRFRAWECNLYLCLQMYKASVSEGHLSEVLENTVTDSWSVCITQYNGTACPSGNGTLAVSTDLSTRPVNTTASISYDSFQTLTYYLSGSNGDEGLMNGAGAGSVNKGVLFIEWTTEYIQAIWENGVDNVNLTFANIATSMTNNMRLRSGSLARGTADTLESYIHVRWLWLLLPLAMVLIAVAFVVATSMQSHRWGIPSWKANVLAAMTHGVGHEVGYSAGRVVGVGAKETASELEEWARAKTVRLRRRGWEGTDYGLVDTEAS